MATANLSSYDPDSIPDAGKMRFGIVVSDWNKEITWSLLEGAVNTLKKHGAAEKNIIIKHVPGSFELTAGAQFLAEYDDLDAVICLGCVIQGETPHFTYICQGVTHGITQLNLDYNLPFIFERMTCRDVNIKLTGTDDHETYYPFGTFMTFFMIYDSIRSPS